MNYRIYAYIYKCEYEEKITKGTNKAAFTAHSRACMFEYRKRKKKYILYTLYTCQFETFKNSKRFQ